MKRTSRFSTTAGDAVPNLTPVVNIAMVVLVVFMLSASFATSELFLNSTVSVQGQGVVAPAEDFVPTEPLEIRLASPGDGTFVARIGGYVTSDRDELASQLLALRERENAAGVATDDIAVVIRPDADVPLEYLVAAYEATARAELTKVATATGR